MSHATHPDGELRTFLDEHREAFEILSDHDDDDIAELFGEFPLELLDTLEADDE